ncbi:NDR1/HIN1-like protein 10 [Lolium rigidum]|uniref:NDR1/HIN1-like protein 10 n=1 Tax=Lolium rigidum TaxID=89674 RepID=UPI001F5C6BEC|nr:NDR1/HIN1-like protein 10 [Lolium rigidum]
MAAAASAAAAANAGRQDSYEGRSASSCSLCFLLKVVYIIIIALGALTIVLWLILRPGAVKATAVSATLSRFDLAGGGQLLQYNLTVGISLRNPNRFRIHYDYADVQASYDGERFGYDPVEPFYLEKKGERTVTAAFSGSSPVDDGGVRTYGREKSEGFYYVKVRLYSHLGFKVRGFNTRRKSKISCTLRLPVPSTTATPVTTQLGTRCSVDF